MSPSGKGRLRSVVMSSVIWEMIEGLCRRVRSTRSRQTWSRPGPARRLPSFTCSSTILIQGMKHKVHIYKEYHSVCPLVGTVPLPSHPLSYQRVCTSPRNQRVGGEAHSPAVRGWGSPNSDDWRKSLALCLLCGMKSANVSRFGVNLPYFLSLLGPTWVLLGKKAYTKCSDKKKKLSSYMYQEIQKGSGAKSYITTTASSYD